MYFPWTLYYNFLIIKNNLDPQGWMWTPLRILENFKHLFHYNSKFDLNETWTNRKVLAHSFFGHKDFWHGLKKIRENLIWMLSNFMSPNSYNHSPDRFILLSIKMQRVPFMITSILKIHLNSLQKKNFSVKLHIEN